jgi:hypothetical protein
LFPGDENLLSRQRRDDKKADHSKRGKEHKDKDDDQGDDDDYDDFEDEDDDTGNEKGRRGMRNRPGTTNLQRILETKVGLEGLYLPEYKAV